MSNEQVIAQEGQTLAFRIDASITTTEICNMSVAAARKKAKVAIRDLENELRTSAKTLSERIKDLTEACKEQACGFMEEPLTGAGTALSGVFGVPVIHKVTPIEGSFSEEGDTFKVRVSIGFQDRTPGILRSSAASQGFEQDLYMEGTLNSGEVVREIFDDIKGIRDRRTQCTEEVREFQEFLDSGIQVLQDEFFARVTESKIRSCEDGESIMASLAAAMRDSDIAQILPSALRELGEPASPAIECAEPGESK